MYLGQNSWSANRSQTRLRAVIMIQGNLDETVGSQKDHFVFCAVQFCGAPARLKTTLIIITKCFLVLSVKTPNPFAACCSGAHWCLICPWGDALEVGVSPWATKNWADLEVLLRRNSLALQMHSWWLLKVANEYSSRVYNWQMWSLSQLGPANSGFFSKEYNAKREWGHKTSWDVPGLFSGGCVVFLYAPVAAIKKLNTCSENDSVLITITVDRQKERPPFPSWKVTMTFSGKSCASGNENLCMNCCWAVLRGAVRLLYGAWRPFWM